MQVCILALCSWGATKEWFRYQGSPKLRREQRPLFVHSPACVGQDGPRVFEGRFVGRHGLALLERRARAAGLQIHDETVAVDG
jgi:hypothetical protein